jgi:thiol-disulfide isomerase/thioredoxin
MSCLVLGGCTAEPAVDPAVDSVELPPMSDTSETGTSQVSVQLKSWEEVQEWVAQQKGKVVVVDIWSTFCTTCMREFPGFVELNRKYPDQLAAASLSVDYYGGDAPESVVPRVEKFLESVNATMTNFVSTDPDEHVLKQLEAASIPIALVYDQEGNLQKMFSNDAAEYGPEGFTYEANIEPLVQRLITGN